MLHSPNSTGEKSRGSKSPKTNSPHVAVLKMAEDACGKKNDNEDDNLPSVLLMRSETDPYLRKFRNPEPFALTPESEPSPLNPLRRLPFYEGNLKRSPYRIPNYARDKAPTVAVAEELSLLRTSTRKVIAVPNEELLKHTEIPAVGDAPPVSPKSESGSGSYSEDSFDAEEDFEDDFEDEDEDDEANNADVDKWHSPGSVSRTDQLRGEVADSCVEPISSTVEGEVVPSSSLRWTGAVAAGDEPLPARKKKRRGRRKRRGRLRRKPRHNLSHSKQNSPEEEYPRKRVERKPRPDPTAWRDKFNEYQEKVVDAIQPFDLGEKPEWRRDYSARRNVSDYVMHHARSCPDLRKQVGKKERGPLVPPGVNEAKARLQAFEWLMSRSPISSSVIKASSPLKHHESLSNLPRIDSRFGTVSLGNG